MDDAGFDSRVDPFTIPPTFGTACGELTTEVPNPGREHVPVEVLVTYTTKPPCAGVHYPLWAAFTEYAKPVPAGYIVHSLEHGAIVLSYRCPTRDDCPELASALRDIATAVPDDPTCTSTGVRARVIVHPDPTLDRLIGVAVWGTSLAADCADPTVLKPFVTAGAMKEPPENTCSPGFTTF